MTKTGYNIDDPYGIYFTTFTVVGWVDLFTRKECQDILIEALNYCQKEKGLQIFAYVIMPSHCHFILSAKEDSTGLSNLIRDLKSYTSKQLIKWIQKSNSESRRDWLKIVFRYHAKYNSNNKEYQIWKQDNHAKQCQYPKFTNQKIDYIHYNPVVSGIVDAPEQYRLSSAKEYAGLGTGPIEVLVIEYGSQEGYIFM